MFTATSGLISLGGSVARPRPAEDMQSYATALHAYHITLRLKSRLQDRSGTERQPARS